MAKYRRTTHSCTNLKGLIAEAKTFLRPKSPTWGEVCERSQADADITPFTGITIPDSQLLDLKEKAEKAKGLSTSEALAAFILACEPDLISTLVDEIVELRMELANLYERADQSLANQREEMASYASAQTSPGNDAWSRGANHNAAKIEHWIRHSPSSVKRLSAALQAGGKGNG